ncbi:MAG: hypothetical protein OEQ18_13665 [Gammaproteobacteria bacterium]|nr:hypothetical protein [Gammaproteobacteria bacterium]
MSQDKIIKIGTLGSLATFAGEATRRMRELYPEFSNPLYFPSMDDCWRELKAGKVDAVVLGAERTGQAHHGHAVIAHGFYVIGESSQLLGCNLYVKSGSTKGEIRRITGHGSIYQCTNYLDREFPGVPREAHGLNSVEAAKAVMGGDGTVAVVGTRSLPQMVSGLEEMAAGIDDGAISSWWAVSNRPLFSSRPEVLFTTSRCGPDGQLGRLIAAIMDTGYLLQTAAPFPVNTGVSIYDYILTFHGKGKLSSVEKVIQRFRDTRLAGAFDKRT